MNAKTPHFDVLLDSILAELKPHSRICEVTREAFEIDQQTIDLCKFFRVPPPRAVAWARLRHLHAFFGGFELFRRQDQQGKSTITMFDPESFMPLFPTKDWYSDAFDPSSYQLPVDPNQPFFSQWSKLNRSVPRPFIIQDPRSEKSEWCLYNINSKNCYATHLGIDNENLLFADANVNCKDSVDVSLGVFSEACYESIACFHCSHVFFSERCHNCIKTLFSRSCYNCTDCFGCVNLRNKQFCFFNEQLSETDYRQRMSEIDLGDRRVVEEWKEKAVAFWNTTYRLACDVKTSINAYGDDIQESRDVRGITIRSSERIYDAWGAIKSRDGWTNFLGVEYERCYHWIGGASSYDAKMTNCCEKCIDIEYCELLTNCEHCFGCIGLKHKKFCIFNKQYTEEEYWPLVDQIKTKMLERGEYGEFFPLSESPFAYNASYAQVMFPLSEDQVKALGGRWYGFTDEKAAAQLASEHVPDRLDEVGEEILSRRFRCPETGRAFSFIKPELEFHRTQKIALPKTHPTARRMKRMEQVGFIRLYEHACDRCGQKMKVRIPPPFETKLYCPDCFEISTLAGE